MITVQDEALVGKFQEWIFGCDNLLVHNNRKHRLLQKDIRRHIKPKHIIEPGDERVV